MKSGGDGVRLQGIQLYTGHGASMGGERDVSYRPAFTLGATVGVAGDPMGEDLGHKLFAIPINFGSSGNCVGKKKV